LLVAAATWSQVRARLAAEDEVAARQEVEAQRKLLLDELNHRVKNTLATVQSIARQTLREGRSLLTVRETFQSRLISLSQTHDLLTRDHWRGAGLAELVRMELAPYSGGAPGRVLAEGPDVWLSPSVALALGMALHELATNAAKYGSLSLPDGRVEATWTLPDSKSPRLVLSWREVGGPPVTTPTHEGFGTRLITSGLKRQLRGEVNIQYLPAGLRCTIDIPLQDAERRGPMA
jgi:two-component sensor histidine kinase